MCLLGITFFYNRSCLNAHKNFLSLIGIRDINQGGRNEHTRKPFKGCAITLASHVFNANMNQLKHSRTLSCRLKKVNLLVVISFDQR